MKKPNGYGSIKKLSGNRRRPFVFVVSVDGKQKPIEYFTTQIEAEIYQAEYNKKQQKILHGHQIIFKELFYRWLPSHIDKYQPAKSTISNYKISFKYCLSLHEIPLKKIKYYHLQDIIDNLKKEVYLIVVAKKFVRY